jgi:GT2 family glycosyltransferase
MASTSVTEQSPEGLAPSVAIVLVNWNGWRDTVECIDSLLALRYPRFHIYLVDNDSTDQSIEQISAWCARPQSDVDWIRQVGVSRSTDEYSGQPVAHRIVARPVRPLQPAEANCRVTLIRSGRNLGFAGGCNVGIQAAGLEAYSFFWLLNPDTVVHRDSLSALVRRCSADERVGMAGSTIRYYAAPDVVQCLGGARLEPRTVTSQLIGQGASVQAIPRDPAAVESAMIYVMGASMLVSNLFVREVGLLQEDYFLYYEEIDWALRGRHKFALAYAPDSHVFHKSGASSSKVMPLFTANLYYRNRLRFVSRFFPESLGAAKFGLAVDLMRHSLRGRWGHARVVACALWNASQLVVPPHSGAGPSLWEAVCNTRAINPPDGNR